jgi:galactokinase
LSRTAAATPVIEGLREDFVQAFGESPRIFRAPGRVNLIGEHTDYNDGFVMPIAIDLSTWVGVSRRNDRTVMMRTQNYPGLVELRLDEIGHGPTGLWSDYVRGMTSVLERRGQRLCGAHMLIVGKVPIGAGLSSSAAIEIATGYALLSISGLDIDRVQLALAAQEAEHAYAGTRCGIMDQFIACNGKAGHALLLDTRSLQFHLLPMPKKAQVVICNTMVKHRLASGEYNVRRAQCEAGVKYLAPSRPGLKALRDVSLDELEKSSTRMPVEIFRRCRHVISENARVLQSAEALRNSNYESFGVLMNESHASLRDDYEVSCAELDLMVDLASKLPGVYGARMTGGGFGGCTVNLVGADETEHFQAEISRRYEAATGVRPEVYISNASEGVAEVVA